MEKDIIERLYDISERPDCEYSTVLYDAVSEIERLRALLKEVDDWVRDLEPFAGADHEPVTVFKKVRAALAEEKSNG